MSATATRPTDSTTDGSNPDKGQLFEVPRLAVIIDDADPSVLKIAVSGSVEVERADRDQVDFYNNLKAGKNAHLEIDAHVAGVKKTHRRDSDGNVDAVVESKSLVVTDLRFA